MSRTKRVVIYSRVSTDKQTTENQERDLREIAERSGWEVIETYRDAGISGAKGRAGRPGFDALCNDAMRRRFDVIMAWSVDRLGPIVAGPRSVPGRHPRGKGTPLPAAAGRRHHHARGKALFQMMGVFAEFERAMISDRVNAGLARAKAKGTKLGRRRIDSSKEKAIVTLLRSRKLGIRKIATKAGVGVGTVQRIAREISAPT